MLPCCDADAIAPRTRLSPRHLRGPATCRTNYAIASATHRSLRSTLPADIAPLPAISPLHDHPFDPTSAGSVVRLPSLVHDLLSLQDVHDVLNHINSCLCFEKLSHRDHDAVPLPTLVARHDRVLAGA